MTHRIDDVAFVSWHLKCWRLSQVSPLFHLPFPWISPLFPDELAVVSSMYIECPWSSLGCQVESPVNIVTWLSPSLCPSPLISVICTILGSADVLADWNPVVYTISTKGLEPSLVSLFSGGDSVRLIVLCRTIGSVGISRVLCVTKRRVDSYYTVMTHVSK